MATNQIRLKEISQNTSKNAQRLVDTNVVVGKLKNELAGNNNQFCKNREINRMKLKKVIKISNAGTSQRLVETNVIVVTLQKELSGIIVFIVFLKNFKRARTNIFLFDFSRHYKAGIGQSSELLHQVKGGFDQGTERYNLLLPEIEKKRDGGEIN